MELTNQELKQINGGIGISLGAGILLAGCFVFIIGAIDGYLNPNKCNK